MILAAAAGAQPFAKFASVNGLRLHYLEWGTPGRPPLVLLHGIARVAHNFDHIAPHFADRYHVIAVDMRGHGDSSWSPSGAYLVEDYVADIEALIMQLKLQNIVLWGNSTGGRVAQMIAGRDPEWVTAVVSEDVGPERPAAISNRRAARMAREAEGWATQNELVAHVKTEYPLTPDALVRNFVEHASKARDDGRIIYKRDPKILDGFVPTDLWSTVSRIKAPILYLLGGASGIVPAETRRQLLQTLPRAEIVEMPGLGHYPSDEKPEEAMRIIDNFLDATVKTAR
jgi:pimeloyl-ACP methyl ester carboxylesterase